MNKDIAIADNIRKHGQHLMRVFATLEDSAAGFLPFVYTIGNHQLGLPELLLIGDNDDVYCRILNVLGELQRKGKTPFKNGELIDFTAKFPARIVDAGNKGRDEYAVQVGVYYKTTNFEVRQVLLADQNGKYPGDPGCLEPYSLQPLLLNFH